MGLFNRIFNREQKKDLDQGLEKTREGFFSKISRAVAGKSRVDEDFLDELEGILISSDVGVDTTVKIIERLEARVARDKYLGAEELQTLLRDEVAGLLTENNTPDFERFEAPGPERPYVILVVGVNGVGKTTTIGKLAHRYRDLGLKVLLGAADTFHHLAATRRRAHRDPRHGHRPGRGGLRHRARSQNQRCRRGAHRYRRPPPQQGGPDERIGQDPPRDRQGTPGRPA
jgi:fused signal recognition particle receptor